MSQPYPPAPRRRRRWPWIVGGILAVIVIAGIAGGVRGGGSAAPAAPSTTGNPLAGADIAISSVLAATPTTAAPDTIVYTITGRRSSMIDYVNPGPGFQQSQITDQTTLPWSKTFTAAPGSYTSMLLSLTAQNAGTGSISCSISIDGKVVASNTSSGQYAIVECQGT